MKRLLNTAYPVRFWLISILWASFFMMVVFLSELDDTMEVSHAFRAWIAVALIAAAFSLPTFIVIHFFFFGLLSKEMSAFKRKSIVAGLAIIGVLMTFFIIIIIEEVPFSELGIAIYIPPCYLVGFLISSFLCDIERKMSG
jgi:hypothetical protein